MMLYFTLADIWTTQEEFNQYTGQAGAMQIAKQQKANTKVFPIATQVESRLERT